MLTCVDPHYDATVCVSVCVSVCVQLKTEVEHEGLRWLVIWGPRVPSLRPPPPLLGGLEAELLAQEPVEGGVQAALVAPEHGRREARDLVWLRGEEVSHEVEVLSTDKVLRDGHGHVEVDDGVPPPRGYEDELARPAHPLHRPGMARTPRARVEISEPLRQRPRHCHLGAVGTLGWWWVGGGSGCVCEWVVVVGEWVSGWW